MAILDKAARLREARMKAGFVSAADAARALGMKYATYAGHEGGIRMLKPEKAVKIAQLFGVDPLWLLIDDVPELPGEAEDETSHRAPTAPQTAREFLEAELARWEAEAAIVRQVVEGLRIAVGRADRGAS